MAEISLNEQEYALIPSVVRLKLESVLQSKQLQISSMKKEMSKQEMSFKKSLQTNDNDLQVLKRKLDMSEEFNQSLKKQFEDTEKSLQAARKDYYDMLIEKENVRVNYESAKQRVERLTQEKIDLNDVVECRSKELLAVQEEMKAMKNHIQCISEGKLESSIKAEQTELKELALAQKEQRMDLEVNLLNKQISSLQEELNERTVQLSTLQSESASRIIELESALQHKVDENTRYAADVKYFKKSVAKKDNHIDVLAMKIREMQECQAQSETHYQNELAAQQKLIELHKSSYEAELKRENELINHVEEYQKMLKTAEKANIDIEAAYQSATVSFQKQLVDKDSEIAALHQEMNNITQSHTEKLNKIKDREIDSYFPTATTVNKMLKENMSLSQAYEKLNVLQEKLRLQVEENENLKKYTQQVVDESLENGPFIYQKLQQHEKSIETVTDLQQQLSKALTAKDELMNQRDSISRLQKHFQRENERLEQSNLDLSRQVRYLIKAVQEAKGYSVQDAGISSTEDFQTEVGVKRVISQHLVTFKDIGELQLQNQKLLAALRDMSEKQEESELQNENETVVKLRTELENCIQELNSLRSDRRKDFERFDSISGEADASANESALERSRISFRDHSANLDDTLMSIKNSLENVNEEYSTFRKNTDEKISAKDEEMTKLRQELTSAKVDHTRSAAELEYTKEKLAILESNVNEFKKECSYFKEKNVKLSESVKHITERLAAKDVDLRNMNAKLSNSEVLLENVRTERDHLKASELKLIQERDSALAEQQGKVTLIPSIQWLRDNFEKEESDACKSLKAQLTKAERECLGFKQRLDQEVASHEQTKSSLKKDFLLSQRRVSEEIIKYRKLTDEMKSLQVVLANKDQELREIKNVMSLEKNAGIEKSMTAEKNYLAQIQNLRKQCADSQNELKGLRDRCSTLQKSWETEKQAKVDQEEKLKDQSKQLEQTIAKYNEIVSEKDEKLKKIALQAKQRIATIMKTKEDAARELDTEKRKCLTLEQKNAALEQANEETTLRFKTLQSQYLAKMKRKESEMSALAATNASLSKRVEELEAQQKVSAHHFASPPPSNVAVNTAVKSAPPAVASPPTAVIHQQTPVRHAVMPQQAVPKPPPTASIRPLPSARITSRNNAPTRAATVVAVQPIDESVPVSQVPQATVTPTQTITRDWSAPSMSTSPEQPQESVENPLPVSEETFAVEEENIVQALEQEPMRDSSSVGASVESASVTTVKRTHSIEEDDNEEEDMAKRMRTEEEEHEKSEPEHEKSEPEHEKLEHEHVVGDIECEGGEEEVEPDVETRVEAEQVPDQESEDDDDTVDRSSDVILIEDDDSEEEEEVDSQDDVCDEEEDEDCEESDDDAEADEEGSSDSDEDHDREEAQQSSENETVEGDDQPHGVHETEERHSEPADDEAPEMESSSEREAEPVVVIGRSEPNAMAAPMPQRPTSVRGDSRTQAFSRQPFCFTPQASTGFDEGDEGIVPSTPTLSVARTGEVFSEALISPQVPQNRFTFNQSSETSEVGQLATQEALGDTNIDLSQFNDPARISNVELNQEHPVVLVDAPTEELGLEIREEVQESEGNLLPVEESDQVEQPSDDGQDFEETENAEEAPVTQQPSTTQGRAVSVTAQVARRARGNGARRLVTTRGTTPRPLQRRVWHNPTLAAPQQSTNSRFRAPQTNEPQPRVQTPSSQTSAQPSQEAKPDNEPHRNPQTAIRGRRIKLRGSRFSADTGRGLRWRGRGGPNRGGRGGGSSIS